MREIIGNRGGNSLTMNDLNLLMDCIETKKDIEETLQIFKEYVSSTIALGLGDKRAEARNAEIAEALNPQAPGFKSMQILQRRRFKFAWMPSQKYGNTFTKITKKSLKLTHQNDLPVGSSFNLRFGGGAASLSFRLPFFWSDPKELSRQVACEGFVCRI